MESAALHTVACPPQKAAIAADPRLWSKSRRELHREISCQAPSCGIRKKVHLHETQTSLLGETDTSFTEHSLQLRKNFVARNSRIGICPDLVQSSPYDRPLRLFAQWRTPRRNAFHKCINQIQTRIQWERFRFDGELFKSHRHGERIRMKRVATRPVFILAPDDSLRLRPGFGLLCVSRVNDSEPFLVGNK
jgi:hypothetical protein